MKTTIGSGPAFAALWLFLTAICPTASNADDSVYLLIEQTRAMSEKVHRALQASGENARDRYDWIKGGDLKKAGVFPESTEDSAVGDVGGATREYLLYWGLLSNSPTPVPRAVANPPAGHKPKASAEPDEFDRFREIAPLLSNLLSWIAGETGAGAEVIFPKGEPKLPIRRDASYVFVLDVTPGFENDVMDFIAKAKDSGFHVWMKKAPLHGGHDHFLVIRLSRKDMGLRSRTDDGYYRYPPPWRTKYENPKITLIENENAREFSLLFNAPGIRRLLSEDFEISDIRYRAQSARQSQLSGLENRDEGFALKFKTDGELMSGGEQTSWIDAFRPSSSRYIDWDCYKAAALEADFQIVSKNTESFDLLTFLSPDSKLDSNGLRFLPVKLTKDAFFECATVGEVENKEFLDKWRPMAASSWLVAAALLSGLAFRRRAICKRILLMQVEPGLKKDRTTLLFWLGVMALPATMGGIAWLYFGIFLNGKYEIHTRYPVMFYITWGVLLFVTAAAPLQIARRMFVRPYFARAGEELRAAMEPWTRYSAAGRSRR